jgi:hypothetical protein
VIPKRAVLAGISHPPPPDTERLFHAVSAHQESMNEFVSMMTGTLPVPQFFDPANVDRIFATAN